MRSTRLTVLAAVAVAAGIAAYALARIGYGDLPPLPRYAPLTLVLLAAAEFATGSSIRARLAGRPRTRPIVPIAVARTAALAKASSVAGAFFTGGYGGLLVYTLGESDRLAAAQADAVTSFLGVLAALGLTAAALYLERGCRTPDPPQLPGVRRRH